MPAPKTITTMIPTEAPVTVTPAWRPSRYTTPVASWLASATVTSGTIHRSGLRYVTRSRTATTAAAARSRVVSTPPKASSASASAPAEPVTAVCKPAGASSSWFLIRSTTACDCGPSPAIGNESSNARPSSLGIAGPTSPSRDRVAKAARSTSTADLSAAVIRPSRT